MATDLQTLFEKQLKAGNFKQALETEELRCFKMSTYETENLQKLFTYSLQAGRFEEAYQAKLLQYNLYLCRNSQRKKPERIKSETQQFISEMGTLSTRSLADKDFYTALCIRAWQFKTAESVKLNSGRFMRNMFDILKENAQEISDIVPDMKGNILFLASKNMEEGEYLYRIESLAEEIKFAKPH